MPSVPDFQSKDIEAEQIVSALRTYGCCVIRGIAPMSLLTEIATCSEKIYQNMDQKFERNKMSEKEHRHCYCYGIIRPFEEDYTLKSGKSMKEAMLSCVLDSVLKDTYAEFFKSNELNMLIPSSHLRRVKKEDAVPYHQDASVMRLQKVHFINSWFPLDPAGIDALCVEIIPEAQDHCWPSGLKNRGGLYGHIEVTAEQIEKKLTAEPWKPVLLPGDVLLLHSYTIHQTNASEHLTKTRRNFELRFGSREILGERSDIDQLEVDFS